MKNIVGDLKQSVSSKYKPVCLSILDKSNVLDIEVLKNFVDITLDNTIW